MEGKISGALLANEAIILLVLELRDRYCMNDRVSLLTKFLSPL
jgi:hypothetical protein